MPKKRSLARKPAATVRVTSVDHDVPTEELRQVASLLVVQGAAVDLGRHILCDHPIVIGRDERVDLCLSDGSISRAHCSVERTPDQSGYLLVDLGSTNGTTVNGRAVSEPVLLQPGDKIFLGASVLRFSYSDSVDVEYHSKVEELVQTDGLTGLDTKRQYDAVFDVLTEQAIAEHSPLTVLVMDVDGLKSINDCHGHEMGSYAITETAKVAREILDEHGHLARYGGDEFVACLPGVLEEEGMAIAERLRKAVAEHTFRHNDICVTPTLSVGLATFPSHVDHPNRLFKAADDALYRAKHAGKNQVASAKPLRDA